MSSLIAAAHIASTKAGLRLCHCPVGEGMTSGSRLAVGVEQSVVGPGATIRVLRPAQGVRICQPRVDPSRAPRPPRYRKSHGLAANERSSRVSGYLSYQLHRCIDGRVGRMFAGTFGTTAIQKRHDGRYGTVVEFRLYDRVVVHCVAPVRDGGGSSTRRPDFGTTAHHPQLPRVSPPR